MIYKVNLIPQERITVIRCSQGDTSLRRFTFQLLVGSSEYALTDEDITYIQSNGAEHSCTISDGLAVLDAYADMTTDPGAYRAKLKIEDSGGGILYSAAFIMEVEPA